jgi:putative transposase
MPRRPRLRLAGIPFHVIQRGNNRTACFYAEDDYAYYLEHLGLQARRYRVRVHAYVLMTNHVHLLVTPDCADGLSQMMKGLGQHYVQYINRSYRRSGTLWEGRFRSCLVDVEHYLLTCYRYIELNPVRAQMVSYPAEYRWSSHRANAYGEADEVLSPHEVYLQMGRSDVERQAAYRELFRDCLSGELVDQLREATNGGFCFGRDRFQREVSEMLSRRVVRGRPGRPKKSVEQRT